MLTKRFTSLSPVSRWLPIDVHEDEFYLTDIGFVIGSKLIR
jgi:hypothetical protein